MPIIAAAPPMPVPIYSGFDYVTVDAKRRNVIAAHSGSKTLLVVDADTGTLKAQVRVGGVRGVAFDPATGHAFAGTAEGRISDVDIDQKKVVRSLEVPGEVDAIAYDAALDRIYADEDNGTKLWVVDAKTFKLIATITLPGNKPEYLAVDAQTHEVYQNIASSTEIAVIDSASLKVRTTFKTPELVSNHPLMWDAGYGQIVVAGTNGVLSVYDRQGNKKGQIDVPKGIDQCDLDATTHIAACAHGTGVTLVQLTPSGVPRLLETATVPAGVHTLAFDTATHALWIVWSRPDGGGDFVQRLAYTPPA
jgi:DNA-binding beta-propeller fold protein YncE